ncbi:ribosomal protection-like ABC-F family protein [Thermoactinomyces mirandus]|uniref:ABC-F type ribosomal protection protein n=1 Tax=Thermoactinomyces mirandus TaxID=2756294 RepID=A0A7W1XSV9_9BACL|nr:ABC-F type ribosomal protection protein [Thermoactinomyces mirandus]MBA4602652.1 ABC-F type ribosomal protection protein [Thermoactinomyces mirandus]
MIICQMQQAKQTYGANTVFENVTCEIRQGERIGVVGRNGTGKTTLLKLIAGQELPCEGQVTWKKGLSIGLLDQMPDVDGDKRVYDFLFEGYGELIKIKETMAELEQKLAQESIAPSSLNKYLDCYGRLQEKFQQDGGYEVDAKIRRVAHGLQISFLLEKKWKQLSGGERTKAGLARLLLMSPDLLLLDEPTNHLDLPAIEWLTEFLSHYDGTVVLVSHDRYFLDEVVTRIFELEQGELLVYHSNYSGYVREREERVLREFQQYQDQQKKIRKMKEAIKRLKDWANRSNPPNEGLHRRAKSMEKALERMEILKKPILEQKKICLDFGTAHRSGEDVVILDGASKRFDKRELFRHVDLHVRFRERVAIVGKNGSGKSTLLKMIMGMETPDEGEVFTGSNVSIGYLSQHNQEVDHEKTILDEFRDKIPVTEEEARRILARYLFYGNTVFRKVKALSGGERMRLRLAQLVYRHHNLLILDEPTNHLDIDSREVLEEALSGFEGTIIAVSHDRYFLDRIFPITYWLKDHTLTRYEGNYSYARQKRQLDQ